MHPVARVRWTLARHPSLYWFAIAACALLAAVSVHRASRHAVAARSQWGTVVEVVVADSRIGRGTRLAASMRAVPRALLPDGALTELPPADAVAARDIAGNAVITELDLAVAALPDDWVTITLAVVSPPVVAGDQVVVLAGGALLCDGVVADAIVDDRVDVAVPTSCALRASGAAASGDLMLGRRG